MKSSLFLKLLVLRGWIKQPYLETSSHKANWNTSNYYEAAQSVLAQPKNNSLYLEVKADVFDYDI